MGMVMGMLKLICCTPAVGWLTTAIANGNGNGNGNVFFGLMLLQ